MGKVRCLQCGVTLHSKSRHDFQGCNCENQSFVDGGNDYTRIGGKNLDLVEVLDPKVEPAWIFPDGEEVYEDKNGKEISKEEAIEKVRKIRTRSRRTPPRKWDK